jgi:hypothetical protein
MTSSTFLSGYTEFTHTSHACWELQLTEKHKHDPLRPNKRQRNSNLQVAYLLCSIYIQCCTIIKADKKNYPLNLDIASLFPTTLPAIRLWVPVQILKCSCPTFFKKKGSPCPTFRGRVGSRFHYWAIVFKCSWVIYVTLFLTRVGYPFVVKYGYWQYTKYNLLYYYFITFNL